jgi:hypothetical protein
MPILSNGQFGIINKVFYNELINKYKNDFLYVTKLEIAKSVHELFETATLVRLEKAIHHDDVENFWVFEREHNALKLELKVKHDKMGYFLYYMRIL